MRAARPRTALPASARITSVLAIDHIRGRRSLSGGLRRSTYEAWPAVSSVGRIRLPALELLDSRGPLKPATSASDSARARLRRSEARLRPCVPANSLRSAAAGPDDVRPQSRGRRPRRSDRDERARLGCREPVRPFSPAGRPPASAAPSPRRAHHHLHDAWSFRSEKTGCDRVDIDVVLRPVGSERAREIDRAAFGRCSTPMSPAGRGRHRRRSKYRCDVDDPPLAAPQRRSAPDSWRMTDVEVRLRSTNFCQASSGMSTFAAPQVVPAFLISTSIGPSVAMAGSTTGTIVAGFDGSATSGKASVPQSERNSATASSSSSPLRATRANLAPIAASASAICNPSPREPPVTSAALPVRSNRCLMLMTLPLPVLHIVPRVLRRSAATALPVPSG